MAGDYQDPRWQRLRLEIMQRDGFACVACGDAESTLHVHHKQYHGELWDTPPADLQTLCESCHRDLGKHPKAGIYWVPGDWSYILINHCPGCRFQWVEEDDGVLWCFQCGWTFEPTARVFFPNLRYVDGKARCS
jgi:hypothetical protein